MKQKLTKQQIQFLNECTKGTWKLNSETGLVDIDGDFYCSSKKLKDFKGIRFGVVGGYFECDGNNLTSLVGVPQEVGKGFDCSNNQLTSLVGAPQKVGGWFFCENSKLTSLEGAPQEVGRHFNCSGNKLKSLEGAPQKVGGDFYCSRNPISEKILKMIWSKMKTCASYYIALALCKEEILKSKNEKARALVDNLDSDLVKGASALNRFGLFS